METYWQNPMKSNLIILPGSDSSLKVPEYSSKIGGRVPGWLSQLGIQFLVSAQVMISWFIGSSHMLGSMLMVSSLLGILSPTLSVPTPQTNIHLKKINIC